MSSLSLSASFSGPKLERDPGSLAMMLTRLPVCSASSARVLESDPEFKNKVRPLNNFETRFHHELFFQIRREPRQQSATETDGIFLLLVDKAGAHNSPRADQAICCRDQNLPSRDARSVNSDRESIASQGSTGRRSENSKRTRTQLGRQSQSSS